MLKISPVQLSAIRAQYAGSVLFNAGFVSYIFLSIRSVQLLGRLPRDSPSRRLLLPYTLLLLVINIIFAGTQNFLLEEATIEGPFGTWTAGGCSSLLVLRSAFVAFPIFLNDALFLYRAGQLMEWRVRVLIVPCLLYLASFAFGIVSLAVFRRQDCASTEGMPPDLVVCILFTAALNVLLGGIIVYKLYTARRSAAAVLHDRGIARRYARLASFVVESALLWVITAVLHVATDIPSATAGIAPFFELLFEITTIVSPALLTYQIAKDKHVAQDQRPLPTSGVAFASVYPLSATKFDPSPAPETEASCRSAS